MEEAKATILIIDDIASNIYALQNLLDKESRIFLSATSGNDGLKIALSHSIDLIILDVHMPDMDGFEVANMLKSNKRTKDIPILFASAEMKEQKNMLQGLEEGAIDYLFKPLNPEITRAKVNVLIRLELQRKKLLEINSALEKSFILINNCFDIVCTIDSASLKFEEYNVAMTNILGYSPDQIANATLLSFLKAEDIPRVKSYSKSALEMLSFETEVICNDYSFKWLQWNIVVKDGKWFSNARDVTERKKSDEEIFRLNKNLKENNQQLENANKELSAFSYTVSHDLRSPLRVLNTYTQRIEDEHGQAMNPKMLQLFGHIKRNAHKMDTLIDNLLEFSRLGKKIIEKRNVNVKELIKYAYDELPAIYDKGVLTIDDLPDIAADINLLRQVVVNLISNAIKYSSKNLQPKIHVGFFKENMTVVYFIKDNGIGFDMEYTSKLFNVFYRLNNSKDFEGTGVGLAIVKRIIEKHGGTIWAEAKVNEGATFYFSLPVE